MFSALLDTCVLYPSLLRDVLLEVAESGVYRALWSTAILDELESALLERFEAEQKGPEESNAAVVRLRTQMARAFPDALVEGWEPLEDSYQLPDPDDRHVVAAAVKGRADVIVTENLRHFPQNRLPADLEVQSADEFLLYALDLHPELARAAVARVAARTGRTGPKLSEVDILAALERSGAVRFAAETRRALSARDDH